jgi:hypothetical protein
MNNFVAQFKIQERIRNSSVMQIFVFVGKIGLILLLFPAKSEASRRSQWPRSAFAMS